MCHADGGQGWRERYIVHIIRRIANTHLKRSLTSYGTGKKNAFLPCYELIVHDFLKSTFDP